MEKSLRWTRPNRLILTTWRVLELTVRSFVTLVHCPGEQRRPHTHSGDIATACKWKQFFSRSSSRRRHLAAVSFPHQSLSSIGLYRARADNKKSPFSVYCCSEGLRRSCSTVENYSQRHPCSIFSSDVCFTARCNGSSVRPSFSLSVCRTRPLNRNGLTYQTALSGIIDVNIGLTSMIWRGVRFLSASAELSARFSVATYQHVLANNNWTITIDTRQT